jgi:acyl-CoA dehydrogenase
MARKNSAQRMLPPIVDGTEKACFAVTEPNTGLNTTQLKTRAVRKGDRYIVNGQKVWISTAQVADKILLLARTTPLEEVSRARPMDSACSTRISTAAKIAVHEIEKLGRKASTPTSCSLPISKFRSRIASAKKATALNISCTG